MSDKLPSRAFEGRPDPLAQFCEELDTPLEVIANLLFIATHASVESVQAGELLRIATEKLKDVRQIVLAHCETDRNPVGRAA